MPLEIYKHRKGYKLSKEHRRKISESSKGKKLSEYTKRKISRTLKGRKAPWVSKARKGTKLSEKTRRKIGKAQQGEKGNNWKGGITSLNKRIYQTYKYRQWRSDVFTRDDFICQRCGVSSGNGKAINLEAHHIKEFSKIIEEYQIKTLEEAMNCEELWNINNGTTLCKGCHNLTKRGNPKIGLLC